MVSAPLHSLPTLSPSDRTLFSAYLAAHQDLPTLASRLASEAAQAASNPSVPSCLSAFVPSPDYADLLLWLAQPHIQALLASHDDAQFRSNRCLAAETIRATLDTCDNDIELRRAATALVRASKPSGARRASEGPQRPPVFSRLPAPETSPSAPRSNGAQSHRLDLSQVELSRQSPPTPRASASALPPTGRTPAPAPRTQGLQSLGSPLTHTFTEPMLVPFPRLPHHSPAADLRAKSGAAPSLPRGQLAHLTPDPLPRIASP